MGLLIAIQVNQNSKWPLAKLVNKFFLAYGNDPQVPVSNAWYPPLPSVPSSQICQLTSISMAPSPSAATVTYQSISSSDVMDSHYGTANMSYNHSLPPMDIYGRPLLI